MALLFKMTHEIIVKYFYLYLTFNYIFLTVNLKIHGFIDIKIIDGAMKICPKIKYTIFLKFKNYLSKFQKFDYLCYLFNFYYCNLVFCI